MNKLSLATAIGCTCAAPAFGQLRIVSMNSSNGTAGTASARVGMGTILGSIGSTVSNDPFIIGSTGIIKPIDVLLLQEVHAAATTGSSYASLLNGLHSTTNYSFGTLNGATSGSGTQGIVYNAAAVSLISSASVGTVSISGQAREVLRYQLRPIGYGSDADIWIYNTHFKAGSGGSDPGRRNVEAQNIRADINLNVPAGANVMVVGDFNVNSGAEAMMTTLTAAGNGQQFDPINKLNWANTDAFKAAHTQSPFDSTVDPGNGFTGSSGGMDDRYDWQTNSGNLQDNEGVSYIADSYQVHGNNATHTRDAGIQTGTGAAANVLFYEASILDHLPIVADYRIPSKLGASVASVPSRVIVNSSVSSNVTVSNTAVVSFASGADELDYNLSSAGNLTGAASGTDNALGGGNNHVVSFSTATPGVKSGTVSVNASSQAAADASFTQPLTTTVLAHATPSFASPSQQNALTIDFDIYGQGLGGAVANFSLNNLSDLSGFTAKLDLDSINGSGNTATLTTNLAPFADLAAGSSLSFVANLSDATKGTFAATYTLNFSDEDLPGATPRGPLLLTLNGIIARPGDVNLDDNIDFDDYVAIDTGFNFELSGWANGDFNRDGIIDFDDYVIIDTSFNDQRPGDLLAAMLYLSGDNRDIPITPQLEMLLGHVDQFGIDYATAFIAAVPEPTSITLLLAGIPLLRRRRR